MRQKLFNLLALGILVVIAISTAAFAGGNDPSMDRTPANPAFRVDSGDSPESLSPGLVLFFQNWFDRVLGNRRGPGGSDPGGDLNPETPDTGDNGVGGCRGWGVGGCGGWV